MLAVMAMRFYRPTKVSLVRAVYLCLLGVFAPARLAAENAEYAKTLN
jgi:hypothetical protein